MYIHLNQNTAIYVAGFGEGVTCDLWVPSPDGWPLHPETPPAGQMMSIWSISSIWLKDAQGCSRHSLGWFSNMAIDLFSDVLISLINLAAWITLCKQCLGDYTPSKQDLHPVPDPNRLSAFSALSSLLPLRTSVLMQLLAAQNLSLLQTSSCEPMDQFGWQELQLGGLQGLTKASANIPKKWLA